MYNRDMVRFKACDLNANGKLNKAEWILFNNPLKDDAVKTTIFDYALQAVDTDKDGKISRDEYLADWHEPVGKKFLIKRLSNNV